MRVGVGQERQPEHLAFEAEVANRLRLVARVHHRQVEFGLDDRQGDGIGRRGVIEIDAIDRGIDLDRRIAALTARREQDHRKQSEADGAHRSAPR